MTWIRGRPGAITGGNCLNGADDLLIKLEWN